MEQNALRSAESSRKATCEFSDQIARLCVSTYRQLCPTDLVYDQTCVAGVVMLLPPSSSKNPASGEERRLVVVALGVGTKTVSASTLRGEVLRIKALAKNSDCQSSESRILRDCHAEVLARRAFRKWLINRCYSASTSSDQFCEYRAIQKVGNQYLLDPQITFHMYSSSQPCGNASVKKWAKGKGVTPLPESIMPKYCFPQDELHPVVHYSAIDEGQIALTVKRSHTGETDFEPSNWKKDSQSNALPSSVAYPKDKGACGVLMSCSDKILSWNCVGLQGGLLSSLIRAPVFLSSITIGRKYSSVHGYRAFCCRAEVTGKKRSRGSDVAKHEVHVNHPPVMCTSVKLDEGAIVTKAAAASSGSDCPVQIGAKFDEPRSIVAVLEEPKSGKGTWLVELVDSSTGLLVDGTESKLSSGALHQAVFALKGSIQNIGDMDEVEDRRGKPIWYREAKNRLKSRLSHPRFGGWRGFYSMLDDAWEETTVKSPS